jgi:hypothetical protein
MENEFPAAGGVDVFRQAFEAKVFETLIFSVTY